MPPRVTRLVLCLGLSALVGCASEDERGSIGPENAAGAYCRDLGTALPNGWCQFSDGSSCEQNAFYGGSCGQSHSYCVTHGGAITSAEVDMGSWTGVVGFCTVDGVQCREYDFWRTGACKP